MAFQDNNTKLTFPFYSPPDMNQAPLIQQTNPQTNVNPNQTSSITQQRLLSIDNNNR